MNDLKLPLLLTTTYFTYPHYGYETNDWVFLTQKKTYFITQVKNYFFKSTTLSHFISRNEFLTLIKKLSLLFVDENIAYHEYLTLKKKIKKIILVKPFLTNHKFNLASIKKNFHLLEMSVIYTYSLIKENLSLKKINQEIYDYLFFKTNSSAKISGRIFFFQRQKPVNQLSYNNQIIYSLQLQNNNLCLNYFKTVFFYHKKKYLIYYQQGKELLEKIKEKITTNNKSITEILFFFSTIPGWTISLRNPAIHSNFFPLSKKQPLDSLEQEEQIYVIKLTHNQHPLVLSEIMFKKKKIFFLKSLANNLVHFKEK